MGLGLRVNTPYSLMVRKEAVHQYPWEHQRRRRRSWAWPEA